jgi:glycosyltransferase involved in cell wall biosynthesis
MAESEILVVLPTLGTRNDLLRGALESVANQRADVSLRIALVCPEGATEARALGDEFGATWVADPGRGMSAAMNAGQALATTEEYTIWLGDDDRYEPGGLKTLRDLLAKTPDAPVAYGACHYVDQSGVTLWTSAAGAWAARLIGIGPNLIPHPAALIRLDLLTRVGGYREDLSLVMDLDVFLRLRRLGAFASTRTPVARFGWQPDSLTVSSRRQSEAEARRVKREHLPAWARPLSWLWEWPVAWASRFAAWRLNGRTSSPSTR